MSLCHTWTMPDLMDMVRTMTSSDPTNRLALEAKLELPFHLGGPCDLFLAS